MPLAQNLQIADTELVLHFETNNVLDVGRLSAVLIEVRNVAREASYFGPQAKVTLRHLVSGSPTTAWISILDVAGGALGVADFGLGLAMLIRESRQRKLPRRLAELLVDDDVVDFTIAVRESDGIARRITMQREELPAVHALRDERERAERRAIYGSGSYGSGTFGVTAPSSEPIGIGGGDDSMESGVVLDGRKAAKLPKWYEVAAAKGYPGQEHEPRIDAAIPPNELNRNTEEFLEFLDADRSRRQALNRTSVFIGKFASDGYIPLFVTQNGRAFRTSTGPNERPTDVEYVVRGSVLQDPAGQYDWIDIKDIFDIDD